MKKGDKPVGPITATALKERYAEASRIFQEKAAERNRKDPTRIKAGKMLMTILKKLEKKPKAEKRFLK